MFTLEVRYSGRWKWGVRTYNTLEDAERRVKELASIGIRSRSLICGRADFLRL